MACTSMAIPTSPAASTTKDIFKEHSGLHRSHSGKDLCKRASIRRAYSDNHLCYQANRIQATSPQSKLKNSRSMRIFPLQLSGSIIPNSLRSFLFDPETSKDMIMVDSDMEESSEGEEEIKRVNWVERLLQIRSHWRSTRDIKEGADNGDESSKGDDINGDRCDCDGSEDGCTVDYSSEDKDGEGKYDLELFSRYFVRVPWSDTKLFSQLAFLSNMAYVIPQMKAEDLRRYYGLEFVTSSLEKKAEAALISGKLDQLGQDSSYIPVVALPTTKSTTEKAVNSDQQKPPTPIRSSFAYEIAAAAATYVQLRAKNLLSPSSESHEGNDKVDFCEQTRENEEVGPGRAYNPEVAAYVAASTMTAVVAAGEKQKQEAAKDLQSLHSSPCEWFVCDDSSTCTRCFVIQGSDSLASWQANLFFEPTKFEGTDVIVHRGIYEAAKGIYEQFMPEIIDHLITYGERAKFQFTGHSLGGSLSLLVHSMLLKRSTVKPSMLQPVVTFGSPFVFCGGQKLLEELGMDENNIYSVMMHRDIVPRAFSCNYPDHVAVVLKRLHGSFRSHSCLIKNKLLYSPMGKIFILQPDEKSSPPHPLLPQGTALYSLNKTQHGFSPNVLRTFLNNPHPLETLSDPTAYGSEGTILRDHDSSNYLKALNGVLRQHTKMVDRKVRKIQRNMMWPLLTSPSPHLWTHKKNVVENSRLVSKEIMSGV